VGDRGVLYQGIAEALASDNGQLTLFRKPFWSSGMFKAEATASGHVQCAFMTSSSLIPEGPSRRAASASSRVSSTTAPRGETSEARDGLPTGESRPNCRFLSEVPTHGSDARTAVSKRVESRSGPAGARQLAPTTHRSVEAPLLSLCL
jgi:hypothetical protein